MDEYVGLPEAHPQSYHSYMRRNLFDHVDIRDSNIDIPNGNASNFHQECLDYEGKIAEFGGIDLFFSGVGHDGDIALNVAGSSLRSRTRVQKLNQQTIAANARFFDGDGSQVPTHAVTERRDGRTRPRRRGSDCGVPDQSARFPQDREHHPATIADKPSGRLI